MRLYFNMSSTEILPPLQLSNKSRSWTGLSFLLALTFIVLLSVVFEELCRYLYDLHHTNSKLPSNLPPLLEQWITSWYLGAGLIVCLVARVISSLITFCFMLPCIIFYDPNPSTGIIVMLAMEVILLSSLNSLGNSFRYAYELLDWCSFLYLNFMALMILLAALLILLRVIANCDERNRKNANYC